MLSRGQHSTDDLLVERLVAPFRPFARAEAAGGIALLAAALIAIAWADSPLATSYHDLFDGH